MSDRFRGRLQVFPFHGNPYIFVLEKDEVLIGRGAEVDVFLDDGKASRSHASLTLKNDGFWLSDVGSLNGTVVNGKKVENSLLSDGDSIVIGLSTIVFNEASPPREKANPQKKPADQAQPPLPPSSHPPQKDRRAHQKPSPPPGRKKSAKWFLPVIILLSLLGASVGTYLWLSGIVKTSEPAAARSAEGKRTGQAQTR